jgi:uncharacterized protein with LGFP repeats
VCGLLADGCFQSFERGGVYSSPSTGVHTVTGAVHARWVTHGSEQGPFGYPTADAVCGLRDGGCLQTFEGGSIYWSPATGAHPVNGTIGGSWTASGSQNGHLGYPVGDQVCGLRAGGCYQHFLGGSIYWSAATGAQPVNGAIRSRWGSVGRENGYLGYPAGGAVCGLRGGGCHQHFQGGSIYWSPATGAQPVNGAIRSRWGSVGWENGFLGYPTGGAVCGLRTGGCYQEFQGGAILWSPASGAQPVNGAIRTRWGQLGRENGQLGYPVAGAVCGLRNGGCLQNFQGASIYWSPASGAQPVNGAIRTRWGQLGWENGYLGYPVEAAVTLPNGDVSQRFQGGALSWSARTGQVRGY